MHGVTIQITQNMVTTSFDLLEQNCYICIHVRQLWFTICRRVTVKHHRILRTCTFGGYMNQKPPTISAIPRWFHLSELSGNLRREVSQVKPLHVLTWR